MTRLCLFSTTPYLNDVIFYQSRQLLDMTLKHLLNILCSPAVTHNQSVMQRSAPFFSESLDLSPNNSRIVSLFQSSFIIL